DAGYRPGQGGVRGNGSGGSGQCHGPRRRCSKGSKWHRLVTWVLRGSPGDLDRLQGCRGPRVRLSRRMLSRRREAASYQVGATMRILTASACLLSLLLPGVATALAAAKGPASPWPRLADGKPVVKTFRLRATIESARDLGWRAPAHLIVFKLQDK